MNECDFCQSTVDHINETTDNHAENAGTHYFCDFCYSTFCANAFLFPSQYRSSRDVMMTIAQSHNKIMAEIKTIKKEKNQ